MDKTKTSFYGTPMLTPCVMHHVITWGMTEHHSGMMVGKCRGLTCGTMMVRSGKPPCS